MSDQTGSGQPRRIGDTLRSSARRLESAGCATPDLDARLLLAEAMRRETSSLHSFSLETLSPEDDARFASFLRRRERGEPVHRILGRRAFYEHDFLLSADTLEPRPDTETLVDEARSVFASVVERRGLCRFADIGTGTGAIAISLLALFEASRGVLSDISPGALATAKRNAERAGVAGRAEFVCSDYLASIGGPLDVVVSNPPYIRSRDILSLDIEVREHDPLRALDGGADGLGAYRAIAENIDRVLVSDGRLIVEIGLGQESDVQTIMGRSGMILAASVRDLGGNIRVLNFERRIGA